MENPALRTYLAELLGTFTLVFIGSVRSSPRSPRTRRS